MITIAIVEAVTGLVAALFGGAVITMARSWATPPRYASRWVIALVALAGVGLIGVGIIMITHGLEKLT